MNSGIIVQMQKKSALCCNRIRLTSSWNAGFTEYQTSMNYLRCFLLCIAASSCTLQIPYQPWELASNTSSVGTGYRITTIGDGIYSVSFEAARSTEPERLLPLLHRLASETCEETYVLQEVRKFETIVTHSTDRSAFVEATLVCMPSNPEPSVAV